jgi:hypothetical protein
MTRRPGWVSAAFGFTLLFASVHLYWAVGGTWGLPLAAVREQPVVRAANWVVVVIMLIGAGFVLALTSRRVPAWILLVPIGIGAVVCVSHGLFGLATKALYLGGQQGAVDFPVVAGVDPATAAARDHLSAVQDLAVFEPCFLLQGVLLALAAGQSIGTRAGRRAWWLTVVAGTVAIDAFGAVLALGGRHFAIS